jgi:predicted ArsR family transcriptional regulator
VITLEEHLEQLNEVQKTEFEARVNDLTALKREFGERVGEIISAARGQKVEAQWRNIAQEYGKNDIEALKATLWKWVGDAGFEFTASETAEGTQFRVTKCPLAEMARSLNAAEWGYVCYCTDDPHIVAGFNPAMGFRRTKTLMQGHECCDHFYYMKAKAQDNG